MGRQGRRSIHRYRHDCHRNHLADSLKRFLLITRRRIPLDRSDDYARLWRNVRHAAVLNGAHAWMFVSTHADDRFVEFVEWGSAEENFPIAQELSIALEALNTAFHPEDIDTWVEKKI